MNDDTRKRLSAMTTARNVALRALAKRHQQEYESLVREEYAKRGITLRKRGRKSNMERELLAEMRRMADKIAALEEKITV